MALFKQKTLDEIHTQSDRFTAVSLLLQESSQRGTCPTQGNTFCHTTIRQIRFSWRNNLQSLSVKLPSGFNLLFREEQGRRKKIILYLFINSECGTKFTKYSTQWIFLVYVLKITVIDSPAVIWTWKTSHVPYLSNDWGSIQEVAQTKLEDFWSLSLFASAGMAPHVAITWLLSYKEHLVPVYISLLHFERSCQCVISQTWQMWLAYHITLFRFIYLFSNEFYELSQSTASKYW